MTQHGQKLLIFMRFHGASLGNQHKIWPKQHNGKVRNVHTRALTEVNGSYDTRSGADVLRLSWLPLDEPRSSVVEYLEHLAIRGGFQPGISPSTDSVIIRDI